jgi:hypothetical protein
VPHSTKLHRREREEITMKIEKQINIIDKRETLFTSIAKDFFSFMFIGLLIYFSQSTFWTFVCAITALFIFAVKTINFAQKRYVTVKTKKDLLAAANGFFDEEAKEQKSE